MSKTAWTTPTVSIEPEKLRAAKAWAKRTYGHTSFSAYVRMLIDRDMAGTAPINHHAHAAAVERAADENARSRSKARRTQPRP